MTDAKICIETDTQLYVPPKAVREKRAFPHQEETVWETEHTFKLFPPKKAMYIFLS